MRICFMYGILSFMKVRYTYRLRPSKTARRRLMREWGMCRYVWNRMVEESKRRHELNRDEGRLHDEGFGDKTAQRYLTILRNLTCDEHGDRWLREGSVVAQQQTVRDFSKARKKALLDRKNGIAPGKRAGLPRFKSKRDSTATLNYTTRGFSLYDDDGGTRLRLAGGIGIPVVWSRPLPGKPSSVRVSQDTDGHWYASFVVDKPAETPLPETGRAIGIDPGVSTLMTCATIDGNGIVDETGAYDLPHPEYGRKAHLELARLQRRMAKERRPKRQKPSNRYLKNKRRAAEIQRRVQRQRQDTANKWARRIVRDHDNIAMEDFKPKFLAKTTMARKAADGAIASVKHALEWQALKHSRTLRLVNPSDTTKRCAHCGAIAKHRIPLKERTFRCDSCRMSRARDKNSALNMLCRAGFIPDGVDGVNPRWDAVPTGTRPANREIPRL
ncbi:putative transposase [Bifidobacterium gallicum DSM 20093 = LMG 11596]|nr:putative transposase [Bifidobacterium gallicum DSM 20093 = LMG 11596]